MLRRDWLKLVGGMIIHLRQSKLSEKMLKKTLHCTCIWAVLKDCTFVDKKQMDAFTSNDMILKILILLYIFSYISNWCVNFYFVVP